MNRVLLSSARRLSARQASPIVSKRLFSSSVYRFQAQKKANDKKTSDQQQPKGSSNRGKVAVLLGLLAIGSTVLSLSYQKSAPTELVEPEKKKTKAFKDGEVNVIFVLGGPGSGKGTQCNRLVEHHKFVHLSAGDLLRAEQNREGSQYGELISKCIKDGVIVPQEVTVGLLKNAMKEAYANGKTRFLIDGFPRKMDQAIIFEDEIATSSFTIFFECPEQVMLQRLLERGKTSGRSDDNIESIKKRFKTFIETSYPVVEYFDKQGKVVKLQCDHPVEVVYSQVEKAIADKIGSF
ncbi:URA6 [Cyberlindnera jadinii]|uniref:Uridylate kinase n=1 Tax=Cyberlindnera jadinii (strain ATCC 18201 / CBS 1600 / BCRC 20928 / JCM 3617 / NBRC 0987 / NRRL Y-1542) TaxID=983966 RepID=A0A0H5CBK8_CYBJN|nr:URA6 [Cyberlindnera jadinii]